NSFALKPDFPSALRELRQTFRALANSSLPLTLDYITGLSYLCNAFYTAGCPPTMVVSANDKKACTGRDSSKIKILTANTLFFPPPFFFDQREKADELVKLIRSYDPDIIFLQEVWDNNSLIYLIRKMPDYHAVLMPSPLFNRSGLLTLSRNMPECVSAELYPLTIRHNFEELLARKGLLTARITFAGQPIWLVNTHLYSAPPGAAFRFAFGQFKQMQKRILSCPGNVIAGGDLNLMPSELEPLLDGIIRDNCNLPTAGFPQRKKKLDYLLAKSYGNTALELTGRRSEWPVFFSDHSPVYAEIFVNQLH
ncbi:MAG: endonuclease/exonuclease/phosphatase family protein, partial [Candidatus Riflebacteria bacterium]|nr:endonuclease/exonuclease/phosphatase family protein [Candidatus Riflebacteria bacterium]